MWPPVFKISYLETQPVMHHHHHLQPHDGHTEHSAPTFICSCTSQTKKVKNREPKNKEIFGKADCPGTLRMVLWGSFGGVFLYFACLEPPNTATHSTRTFMAHIQRRHLAASTLPMLSTPFACHLPSVIIFPVALPYLVNKAYPSCLFPY